MLFLIPSVNAVELTKANPLINNNTKYKAGDIIFIDHKIDNDDTYLKAVQFINIYHSYDKNVLDFLGIMSTQPIEYCNFRVGDYMTCSVIKNVYFKTGIFARTAYRLKAVLNATTLNYNYLSNVSKVKTANMPITVTAPKEEIKNFAGTITFKVNTKSKTIKLGETYKLDLTLSPESARYDDLTYSSSNSSATVDTFAYVAGKAPGTATITVSYGRNKEDVSITVIEAKEAKSSSKALIITTFIFASIFTLLVVGASYLFRARRRNRDDIYIGE